MLNIDFFFIFKLLDIFYLHLYAWHIKIFQ